MKTDIHVPIGAPKTTMAGVLHRWGPGKLWAIFDEGNDLDVFVRAETEEDALAKARAAGSEGELWASEQDESTRDAINERLSFAATDIRFLLRHIGRLANDVGARVDDFGGTHCPRCETVDGNGLVPACPTCGWAAKTTKPAEVTDAR